MKRMATVTLLLAFAATDACSQAVVLHPQPEQALAQKWAWAAEQAAQPAYREGYWIGYSIQRLMGERSFIGAWSGSGRQTTLNELIYGVKAEFDPLMMAERRGDREPERKVHKDVALLFAFAPGASQPSQLCASNLSGHVDLDGRPLLWLGGSGGEESLALVQQQYARAVAPGLKEDLVMAVAIHDDTAPVVDLLAGILTGGDDDRVREQAAFWLGQQDDEKALGILKDAATGDRSVEVRKQAVFGISQTDLPAATEVLIDLARTGRGEVRKQAIFWLGQSDDPRALEALIELARS